MGKEGVALRGNIVRFLLLMAPAALLSVSWVQPAVAGSANADRPVLFVHGYEAWGCASTNATETFEPTIDFLRQRGWHQDMVTVGYYSCDVAMNDTLEAYGRKDLAPTADRDADLRSLAYHLAWMIWSRYSSRGVGVDLVAHSMGGLIVRWMLYRMQAHEADFPPRLYVRAVVSIAAPHAGAPFAAFCPSIQCQEMTAGSSFLDELSRNAVAPQGTGGTVWNLVGSSADQVVPADSSTSMGAAHTVVYSLPAYGHDDYLLDPATAADAHVTYMDPGQTAWSSSTGAPHAIAWLTQALEDAG
jgi:triacylglycerol esterase/lipase EstA (alpha/beta hydrolase family)